MAERTEPEPIYPGRAQAVTDGEHLRVLGVPAGPAGASTLDLRDGSVWQVDHAVPTSLVQLDVEDADPASSPLLTAAFGGEGALLMLEDAIEVSGDGYDSALLGARRPPLLQMPPRGRPLRHGVAAHAGRVVLLADLADDDRLHPLARVAAAIEAANALAMGVVAQILEPLGATLVDRAVRLAGDFDDDEVELLDTEAIRALHDVFSTARKLHGHSAASRVGLGVLLERALRITAQPPAGDIPATGIPASGISSADIAAARIIPDEQHREAELDVSLAAALPPSIAAMRGAEVGEPTLRRIGDSLLEATVTRNTERRWVRVLRRSGFVLLGQAPFRRRGLIDVAEVVVPADVLDEDLEVQVVDDAALSRLVDRPLDAIREAITAGREAARADRLGEVATARVRWDRCALLWEHAGDRDRARLARELSGVAGMQWIGPIEAVDRVADSLAMQV